MHLVINAVGVKHSGGATVLLDFLNAALNDCRIKQVTIFCSPRATRRFDLPDSPMLYAVEQPLAEQSYLARLWWSQVSLAKHCQHLGADVLFCMTGIGRVYSDPPLITFIQQTLPFSKEALLSYGLCVRVRMRFIKRLMRLSCRSAQRVLVQTPTMQRWVSQQLNIPFERISAVLPSVHLNSASSGLKRKDTSEVSPPLVILYVGSAEPFKNIKNITEGMEILRSAVPSVELHLTWSPDQHICKQPGVKCLGFLAKEQLVQAYREATALVMPSLVETVGLPMLEAMSLGIPVLAADRPYAHDICEDAALFFDPLSPEDFALKARQMLSSPDLRDQLTVRGHSLTKRRVQATPYAEMVDIVISSVPDTHRTDRN